MPGHLSRTFGPALREPVAHRIEKPHTSHITLLPYVHKTSLEPGLGRRVHCGKGHVRKAVCGECILVIL